MSNRIGWLAVGMMAGVLASQIASSAESAATLPTTAPTTLGPNDAQTLDKLLADGLPDPKGLRFVRFKLPVRDVWTGVQDREVCGWLMEPSDKAGGPWALLDTGEPVPVVGTTEPAEFVARCQAIMDAAVARATRRAQRATQPASKPKDDRRRPFRYAADGDPNDEDAPGVWMQLGAMSIRFAEAAPAPYLAAWLHRLGHDDLAARMLYLARLEPKREEKPIRIPRRGDSWNWYADAVHAYMVRADAEAWFYIHRMAEYFPESMKTPAKDQENNEKHFPEAALLLADLERRQKEGRLGKPAPELPADLAKWPVDKRVAHLIQQLDEVDARQHGQPGGIGFGEDPRVAALIAAGDPAVPALIDCIDKDTRLTRSVHFWRDFSRDRTPIAVREPALVAVMSILKTRFFQPVSTGDSFTARGEGGIKQTVEHLRSYWKQYGHLPFDQRMMTILTDPKANPEAWREAAQNLANLGEKRVLGTTVFTDRAPGREDAAPNPVIAKFKNPTVAQSILAAMDRDLANHDRGKHDRLFDYDRIRIEATYIDSLMDLGDRAILPELRKRLEKPSSSRMRRLYCSACCSLGDAAPMTAFAEDVRMGRLEVSAERKPETNDKDQPGAVELRSIVHTLTAAARTVPAADAALHALAEPKHPLFTLTSWGVHSASWHSEDHAWLEHPYCLRFFLRDLDDQQPTGTTYAIEREGEQDRLTHKSPRSSGSEGLPERLRDPDIRRERVEARVCDDAAERLSQLVLGVPYYHPLLKDSDSIRARIKAYLETHLTHLRRATYPEQSVLDLHAFDSSFILAVRPMDHGATAEDVAQGRAIFHFDGKGTPVKMELPAKATLKRDQPPAGKVPTQVDVDAGRAYRYWKRDPKDLKKSQRAIEWRIPQVLVVQAERGPDATIYYGVVTRESVEKFSERDLVGITDLKAD